MTLPLIYARSDSSRLPGKVLKKVQGTPLIDIIFKRLSDCNVESPVLVTTSRIIDNDLVNYAEGQGYRVFRGNPFNLVERTREALDFFQPTSFLRVNGDSPFLDAKLINFTINTFPTYYFASNLFHRTFPYGVSVELINTSFYIDSLCHVLSNECEHVTQHLYRYYPYKRFVSIIQNRDDSALRLTIDTKKDYSHINSLFSQISLTSSYTSALGLPSTCYSSSIIS
tara:strand:- start:13702 stop:14379 length:678 start_codon:yes stop_codon:yes gene_type:complete